MSLLKLSAAFGLVLVFAAHMVSTMDFSAMNFARDTMMQFSRGTEQTIQILKPDLKSVKVKVPVLTAKRKMDKTKKAKTKKAKTKKAKTKKAKTKTMKTKNRNKVKKMRKAAKKNKKNKRRPKKRKRKAYRKRTKKMRKPMKGGQNIQIKTKTNSTTKLVFVRQTKTYRARSTPSNSFLEALTTIERGVANAKAQKRIRYSSSKLQEMKKTIELAVRNRLFKYGRHKLGETLFLIKEHNSSRTSRSRRSTQNEASVFINDLKRTMGPTQFDKFMGVRGEVTLMFAIDTTGSMRHEIDTAKRIAVDVINYPRENPVNYILSPFSDPTTGPVSFKNNTEGALFVDAIGKLKADGGGDCPELTMKGILDAMYKGPNWGSPLYVFTDASAKDATPENIDDVKSMAKYLGVTINFFTTGLCRGSSVRDNPFLEIAEATSGQMLSLTSTTELQKLNGFTGSVLGGSTIISTGSKISNRKKRAASTASRYSIKIDDSIGKIFVSVTTDRPNQGKAISLTDPQGVTVTSGKVSMSKVSIYEIASPKVGTWTLVILPSAGMHNYFVKSTSASNIDFEYYFLRTIRRPPSEVPIPEPLLGQASKLVLTVAGAEKIRKNSVVLELISKYGKHIRDIQLTPDKRGVRYTATLTPPSRPFKLKIKGSTKIGNPFERVSRNIVEPKSIQLRVLHSFNDFTLIKGRTSTVTFHLYNAANVNKVVNIRVKDQLGYARVQGNVRTVIRRRSAFFRIRFTTPSNANVNTSDTAVVSLSVNNGAERLLQPLQLIVVG